MPIPLQTCLEPAHLWHHDTTHLLVNRRWLLKMRWTIISGASFDLGLRPLPAMWFLMPPLPCLRPMCQRSMQSPISDQSNRAIWISCNKTKLYLVLGWSPLNSLAASSVWRCSTVLQGPLGCRALPSDWKQPNEPPSTLLSVFSWTLILENLYLKPHPNSFSELTP